MIPEEWKVSPEVRELAKRADLEQERRQRLQRHIIRRNVYANEARRNAFRDDIRRIAKYRQEIEKARKSNRFFYSLLFWLMKLKKRIESKLKKDD